MPIPDFNAEGRLPAGIHRATLKEVKGRFGGGSDRRQYLLERLYAAAKNMIEAGVPHIWIDGSFVTDKTEPNDIDGCWKVSADIDYAILDPVFWGTRQELMDKYCLDFFQDHLIEAGSGEPFPVFFQTDRLDNPRGIIFIDLSNEQGDWQ